MSETIKTILTAETRQFHSEFAKAQERVGRFQKNMMALAGTLAGSAVLTAAVGKFNSLRNSIDQLNDQAARLEMPVEEMARLNAVATMSGASVETLAKALNKSKLNAVEATKGSEGLTAEFAALGINAKEFLEQSPTEQLVAISKGFNAAANQGEAFAAVFKVMGRGAADLVPLLRDGEAGIEAISKRLQVLGGEDVAAIAAMNDEVDLLSSNLDTKLKSALLSLRPQIEGIISLLSDAAEGFSIFLDPSGGVGKSGGGLGGSQMIAEMDRLNARIEVLKNSQAEAFDGDEYQIYASELKNSVAAVQALQSRFQALEPEAKAYAKQLAEMDRLMKSGLGEEAMREQLESLHSRTQESIAAVTAEKDLATAAADTAQQMEKQESSAKNIAREMNALRDKVAGRIFDMQTPEVRRDSSRAGLKSILDAEGAGSLDELRRRVGSATTDDSRNKALKALDAGLNRMEEIRRASEEIRLAEQTRSSEALAHIDDEIAKLDEKKRIKEAAEKQSADFAAARKNYDTEMNALRLEVAGRKTLADQMRNEHRIREEALGLVEKLGLTEDQALERARERANLEKQVSKLKAVRTGEENPTGSRRRGIRRLENGANDMNAGNNLNNWRWNLGPDSRRIDAGGGRRIGESFRATELRRRAEHRTIMTRPQADPNTSTLERTAVATEALLTVFKQLGAV